MPWPIHTAIGSRHETQGLVRKGRRTPRTCLRARIGSNVPIEVANKVEVHRLGDLDVGHQVFEHHPKRGVGRHGGG